MKKNVNKSYMLFYTLAIILLTYFFLSFIIDGIMLSNKMKIIIFVTGSIMIYIGSFILSRVKQNNKYMKLNLYIMFIMYFILLLSFTLFDTDFNRNWCFILSATQEKINNYIKNNVNLIPFRTIIGFLKEYNNQLDISSIIINIYGNFVAFIPMAFFLPILFKKQKNWMIYLLTICTIVLSIEAVQFITLSGAFDIDDIILNVSGSILMYFVFRIKDINNLFKNIFLLESNIINKKKVGIMIGVICILFLVSILYIQHIIGIYYFDYKDYERRIRSDITFKYDNSCSDNNLFYEDKVYKYYLKCFDNDSFYAVVNEKEYKIQDLLDNSEYLFNIDVLLEALRKEKIKYYYEHKYNYYISKVNYSTYEKDYSNSNQNVGYSVECKTNNNNVEVILVDMENVGDTVELNFIPKHHGKTTITLITTITVETSNSGKIINVEEKNINEIIELNVSKDLEVNIIDSKIVE